LTAFSEAEAEDIGVNKVRRRGASGDCGIQKKKSGWK
jgi:hypothetical protein